MRYRELAIFPEDVDIPLATVQRFWKHTGNLSCIKAELFCQRLAQLSLLLEYDLARRTLRLHDVVRTYLRDTALEALPNLNQQFLAAYTLFNQCSMLHELASTLHTYLPFSPDFMEIRISLEQRLARPFITAWHPLPDQPSPALIRTLSGHVTWVNGCAISPSGEWIVSCSRDNTLKLWDAHTREERMTLVGHTNWVNGCAVSPSDEWIVSCSYDHTLKLWDAHTGMVVVTLRLGAPLTACAFCPDGEHIIVSGAGCVYFLRIVW